jgi:adenine-specific DNA-methyltransferase
LKIRNKNKLGQYFTPDAICDFMLSLSSSPLDAAVLEPSSGAGAFLDALKRKGFSNVTGVEVDPDLASHSSFEVINESFITFNPNEKFDLIIGNPPYIRWKDLEADQKDELKAHWMFGPILNSLSDYLLPFIALSIQHLKPGGELIFITPSFWLQTKHSENLRNFLDSHGAITHLVDFGEVTIFPKVATSLVVFRFVKGESQETQTTLLRYQGKGGKEIGLAATNFQQESVTHFRSKGKFVPIFDSEAQEPLALERACEERRGLFGDLTYSQVGEVVNIANGMVTGLDEAFKISALDYLDIPEKERLGISRVIKGKNTTNLVTKETSWYIDLPRGLEEGQARGDFPALFKFLDPYADALRARYSYGDDAKWWEWSFYRSESFHRSNVKKGFVPGKERMTNRDRVRFNLGPDGAVATQDVTAFAPMATTRESIEYIVAFLNRQAVSSWIRAFGLMKGGVAEFSEKPLGEIPFRRIDWDNPVEVEIHSEVSVVVNAYTNGHQERSEAESKLQSLFEKLMPGLGS